MHSSTSTDDQKYGAPSPQLDAASASPPFGGSDQKHGTTPPTPPYGQPVAATRTSDPEGPWSTGLFQCCSGDVRSCCITFWCPFITFGQIAEIVDKGSTSCGASAAIYALIMHTTCSPCCYSRFYRTKLRQQYMLRESPCPDFLVHCCCESCALRQEYRELQNRGFDMSLGWHENVKKHKYGMVTAPVVENGMSK